MKTLLWRRTRLGVLSTLAGLALLTAVPVLGQEVPGGEALWPLIIVIFLVSSIPFYIYWAWATQTIARKTQTEKGWLAWVPIANFILWANIARKPIWWSILCMMPFVASFFMWTNIARKPIWWGVLCIIALVGLVFTALMWMAIAQARKKPGWWGILMVVPVANLIVPGYLAWSD